MTAVRLLVLALVVALPVHAVQLQGQAQHAVSGSASGAASSTTTTISNEYRDRRDPVSSAVAMPGAVAGGDRRCAIGVGAGAQFVGFGGAIAGASTEQNCVRLRDADMALMLNYRGKGADMAHAILCGGEHYRRGAAWAGIPCPTVPAVSAERPAREVR